MAKRKYLKPRNQYLLRIGQNIRRWRDLKGIKQSELARLLGVEPSVMSEIENDIAELTLARIEDIADVLGLKPEQLLENPSNKVFENAEFSEKSRLDKELLNRVLHLIEVLSIRTPPSL